MQSTYPLPEKARVALLSPAGPFHDEALLPASVQALCDLGYEPVVFESARGTEGYLAASDEVRAADLMQAFCDPTIQAIFCTRGGYGCMRILDRLDYDKIRENKKPLIGLSDVTALHLALYHKAGLCTLHAPMPFRYPTLPKAALKRLKQVLRAESGGCYTAEDGLFALHGGKVTAPMIGGNLTLVASLLASDYCPDFSDCVLFLEEVSEAEYRIDRLLTTLRLAYVFEQVRGVVLGSFSDCGRQEALLALFRERIPSHLPVLGGFPAGHLQNNHAFVHGGKVTLNADDCTLSFFSEVCMKQKVFSHLDAQQETAIALVRELISFESVATPSDDPDAPQGREVARCLSAALAAAERLGLTARNLDGLAGLIDSDENREAKIGMLCHLDVVPVGDGWTHDPLGGEIADGKLYGRGTTDDKGPFVSALLALSSLKACGAELKYPIRLIAGTCEETGSADIAYCKEKGVIPPHVFSPDANYPVVNTEKGISRFSLSATLPKDSALVALSGGEVVNMVPQNAQATLCDGTEFAAVGKSAHASLPHLGENALSKLFNTLAERLQGDPAHAILCEAEKLHPLFSTDGSALGIAAADQLSGELTASLGLCNLTDGVLTLTFDVRFPLCVDEAFLRSRLQARLENTPFALTALQVIPPHHVDEHSPFVQSLLAAYTEISGQKGYCIAIGGGTYVHDLDGGVAFGTVFPGEDCRIHSPDEFVPVQDLIRNAKIFAAALLNLQEQTL